MDHRQLDERSLAFGCLLAQRISENPGLIAQARATATRWLQTSSARSAPALHEWLELLNGPLEGVIQLLIARDERATRLRQSNPFAGALSPQERNEIIRRFQPHDPATA